MPTVLAVMLQTKFGQTAGRPDMRESNIAPFENILQSGAFATEEQILQFSIMYSSVRYLRRTKKYFSVTQSLYKCCLSVKLLGSR